MIINIELIRWFNFQSSKNEPNLISLKSLALIHLTNPNQHFNLINGLSCKSLPSTVKKRFYARVLDKLLTYCNLIKQAN